MRVREWMSPSPVTVAPKTSVLNARRLLTTYRIRHLPVVEGGRLVGMVSDRDLRIGDPELLQSLAALQSDLVTGRYRRVSSVMSSPVEVIRADEPISLAAELMIRWRISALPVIEDGRLVGVITTSDCLRALQLLDRRPAEPDEERPAPERHAATTEPVAGTSHQNS